mmetsp:Transcript_17946/g.19453  ORF Transcript_17946/g.19453 Transcript_17946/m.19453 type:complete len:98 (-) Transcript_17946:300-593(-)
MPSGCSIIYLVHHTNINRRYYVTTTTTTCLPCLPGFHSMTNGMNYDDNDDGGDNDDDDENEEEDAIAAAVLLKLHTILQRRKDFTLRQRNKIVELAE